MISQGNWSTGKIGGVVVTDNGEGFPVNTGHGDSDCKNFYGGYLIAESILKKDDAQLISAAKDLLEACRESLPLLRAINNYHDTAFIVHKAIQKAEGK